MAKGGAEPRQCGPPCTGGTPVLKAHEFLRDPVINMTSEIKLTFLGRLENLAEASSGGKV